MKLKQLLEATDDMAFSVRIKKEALRVALLWICFAAVVSTETSENADGASDTVDELNKNDTDTSGDGNTKGNETASEDAESLPSPEAFIWDWLKPNTKYVTVPVNVGERRPFLLTPDQIQSRFPGKRNRNVLYKDHGRDWVYVVPDDFEAPQSKYFHNEANKANKYSETDYYYDYYPNKDVSSARRPVTRQVYRKVPLPQRPKISQEVLPNSSKSVPLLQRLLDTGTGFLKLLNPLNYLRTTADPYVPEERERYPYRDPYYNLQMHRKKPKITTGSDFLLKDSKFGLDYENQQKIDPFKYKYREIFNDFYNNDYEYEDIDLDLKDIDTDYNYKDKEYDPRDIDTDYNYKDKEYDPKDIDTDSNQKEKKYNHKDIDTDYEIKTEDHDHKVMDTNYDQKDKYFDSKKIDAQTDHNKDHTHNNKNTNYGHGLKGLNYYHKDYDSKIYFMNDYKLGNYFEDQAKNSEEEWKKFFPRPPPLYDLRDVLTESQTTEIPETSTILHHHNIYKFQNLEMLYDPETLDRIKKVQDGHTLEYLLHGNLRDDLYIGSDGNIYLKGNTNERDDFEKRERNDFRPSDIDDTMDQYKYKRRYPVYTSINRSQKRQNKYPYWRGEPAKQK